MKKEKTMVNFKRMGLCLIVIAVAFLVSCCCSDKSSGGVHDGSAEVPYEIVIYYKSGHFGGGSRRLVNAEKIIYEGKGQYSREHSEGSSSKTLLENLYIQLGRPNPEQLINADALARIERARGGKEAEYVAVMKFEGDKNYVIRILHDDTVTRGGRAGRHQKFGEFLRDFKTISWYLREKNPQPEKPDTHERNPFGRDHSLDVSDTDDGVITNSIGMKLKRIEAGEFMMGSEKSFEWMKPIHKVKITRPFHIGVYEITQAQYKKIMGKNPSHFKGPRRPVNIVSWRNAMLFCEKLSEKEGVEYRLPTEAEWEYACRAGTTTVYYWGDEMDDRYVWHCENSGGETHDVGKKKPNDWGLYDMSGNVSEWCSDWYDKDYYSSSPSNDPRGPAPGDGWVFRGGSWCRSSWYCRSASRLWSFPGTGPFYGFRVVRAPD